MASRRGFSIATTLVIAAGLAACGGGSSGGPSPVSSNASASTSVATSSATGTDSAVAALVPSAIRAKGTLTVAADAHNAPDEFLGPNGTSVVGMDADLASALGALMGLNVNVVNASAEKILPGVAAGRYDLGASSFIDTRRREKVVDFVDYFQAGTAFLTKSSGGAGITGLASLCGKTVSVKSGTTEESAARAQSARCKRSKVTVLAFPTQDAASLALSDGRAVVSMAASPAASYQVKKSGGAFRLVGQTYGTAPYGLAIAKHSGLQKALLAGLRALIENGEYAKILSTWGVQAGALPVARVKLNGAAR